MEEAKRHDHNKLAVEMKILTTVDDRTGIPAYHAKRCDHDAGAQRWIERMGAT